MAKVGGQAVLGRQQCRELLGSQNDMATIRLTVRERRKEPREGSEIDPETACIQTVGAWKRVTAYLLYNGSATYIQWQA